MTKSPKHDNVFWVHGDSGTGNWLFAIDRDGELLTRMRVKGATNVDWEDITHDDQGNLWLGDIGNNDSSRRDLAVYRIAEPPPDAALNEVRVDLRVPFSYPEQTLFGDKRADFDAESLFWWRGDLWLLTKHRSDDLTHLYRFPALTGEAVELERVATFDLGASFEGERKRWTGQASAAEVAPDGRHWALLSYDAIFVFEIPPTATGAELFPSGAEGGDGGAEGDDDPRGERKTKLVTRIGFDQDVTRQVEALTWDGEALLMINEDRHVFRIDEPLAALRYPP